MKFILDKIRELLNRSILNKLIISFVVIILSPVLIISLFSYNRLVDSTKTAYNKDNVEILKTMDKNLQIYFEDFERLTYNAFLSKDIQTIMSDKNDDENSKYENQQTFNTFIENLTADRNDIEGVYLICNNRRIYYKASLGGDVKFDYDLVGEPWFKDIEKSNGQFVIVGSHAQEYKYNVTYRYVLSAARKIKDLNTGETLGYFVIEIKPDVFYKMFKDIDRNERHIIIVDSQNNVIFEQGIFDQNSVNYVVRPGDTVKSIANKYKIPVYKLAELNEIDTDEALSPGQSLTVSGEAVKFNDIYPGIDISTVQNEMKKGEDGSSYFISKHVSQIGWTFVEIAPVKRLLGQINSAAAPIIIISFLSFTIFLVASFYISRNIAHPIKVLEDSMKRVKKGDFSQKVVLDCGGEIGSLAANFNIMVEEIQNLIHKVYETQLKKLDSEFKALQAQINPHFLYNTLESINCLAKLKEEKEISEMVKGLAKMFRYSIKQENEFVTLQDEIEHVKNYILLQALRYEDKFDIHYIIPEHLLKAKVIKLILQPVVENAIYHGIEKTSEKGLIRIEAYSEENNLIIVVSDNGAGIEKNKLMDLKNQLEMDMGDLSRLDNNSKSIGIINIHLRLRLYYGDSYGLEIGSVEREGTTVKLVLPMK